MMVSVATTKADAKSAERVDSASSLPGSAELALDNPLPGIDVTQYAALYLDDLLRNPSPLQLIVETYFPDQDNPLPGIDVTQYAASNNPIYQSLPAAQRTLYDALVQATDRAAAGDPQPLQNLQRQLRESPPLSFQPFTFAHLRTELDREFPEILGASS